MLIMKNILLLTISILFCSNSFAQSAGSTNATSLQSETIDSKKNDTNKTPDTKKDLTQEQISSLNNLLQEQKYEEFFTSIKSFNASDSSYISYLRSKSYEGHIPVYWLMADYYAKNNKPLETHKWFYISLITTQQDSYLCTDITARNAPRILMKSFPTSAEVTRKSPQFIEQSMREVNYFIPNLHNRPSPLWVCYYGEDPVKKDKDPLIPKSLWPTERDKVFKRFSENYQN